MTVAGRSCEGPDKRGKVSLTLGESGHWAVAAHLVYSGILYEPREEGQHAKCRQRGREAPRAHVYET